MCFAGTWMDLEKTILNEVTQTQKDRRFMLSLIGSDCSNKKSKETTVGCEGAIETAGTGNK